MGIEQNNAVKKIRRAWELRAAAVIIPNYTIMWERVAPELENFGPSERSEKIREIEAQIKAAGVNYVDTYSNLKKRDKKQNPNVASG